MCWSDNKQGQDEAQSEAVIIACQATTEGLATNWADGLIVFLIL